MTISNTARQKEFWQVNRIVDLSEKSDASDNESIEAVCKQLPGFVSVGRAVSRKGDRLIVRYDASQTDYETLLKQLGDAGYFVRKNWVSEIRRMWYRFTDANAKDNANLPPPACCNKPPPGTRH